MVEGTYTKSLHHSYWVAQVVPLLNGMAGVNNLVSHIMHES